jgi:iron-sulfur cluster assembly protein
MLSMTEGASAKVRELLDEQGKADHAVRVSVRGMTCSGPAYEMALESEPQPDDRVAQLDGFKLLVDPRSAPYVEGARVDYVESFMGKGFAFENPDLVQSGCGCGGCGCTH